MVIADFTYLGIEKRLHTHAHKLLKRLYPEKKIKETAYTIHINKSRLLYKADWKWSFFNPIDAGHGYGLISLIAHALNISFTDAIAWGEKFLEELEDSKEFLTTPISEVKEPRTSAEKKEQTERYISRLLAVSARHRLKGTPAATYLRTRGIILGELSSSAKQELGCIPSCYHTGAKLSFPVLLAPLRDCNGRVQGVLRTFLAHNGKAKAPINTSKLALGSTTGASIHLTPPRKTLILTEGLEDGLSILQAINPKHYGVWCAVGGNLLSIIIPRDEVNHVVLAVDNDKAGQAYINKLAPRLKREGFRVSAAIPTHGKDFNEMLCRFDRSFTPNLIEEL